MLYVVAYLYLPLFSFSVDNTKNYKKIIQKKDIYSSGSSKWRKTTKKRSERILSS